MCGRVALYDQSVPDFAGEHPIGHQHLVIELTEVEDADFILQEIGRLIDLVRVVPFDPVAAPGGHPLHHSVRRSSTHHPKWMVVRGGVCGVLRFPSRTRTIRHVRGAPIECNL